MGTHSFVYEIETEDFQRDVAKVTKTRFVTNGCSKDDNRPVLVGKTKNIISMTKDGISKKIITEFVTLRTRVYAYRKIDRKLEDKRYSGTKKCIVAESLTFDNFKTCLF